MAGKKRKKLAKEDLPGIKYFKPLAGMLHALHDVACERDRAGNRILHMDQYVSFLLLFMFSPLCDSLRALQEASELKNVRRKLGVGRTSLGSLSEAARVFDSELLLGVIGELAGQLKPLPPDARLSDIQQIVTLVDGSWLHALPKIASALWCKSAKQGAVKTHVQFELFKGVPVAAAITDAKTSETAVLAGHLEAGRLYVQDRGYADYGLLAKIMAAGSSFVCRLRDNTVFEVVEERELSHEALDEGIVRDAIVRLGCKKNRHKIPQLVRIVEIECREHRNPSGKTGRGGPEQGETILVATDLTDLPPETIGLLFSHRWGIEIFFRFFKHVLGCDHLLSTCRNGIELQMYAAIIACLLIALWTHRKPTRKTYRMVSFYLAGWADEQELLAHIDKLNRQKVAEATS